MEPRSLKAALSYALAASAALARGDMGAVEADVHLVALLDHADLRVRDAAAATLVQFATPVAQTALLRRLRDPDPALRHHAARAVARTTVAPAEADADPAESGAAWLARQGGPR